MILKGVHENENDKKPQNECCSYLKPYSGLLNGIYLGAAINLEGYLGIILAIAVRGFFIIRAIEDKK